MAESNPPDDAALIQTIQTGTPAEAGAAFEQLVSRHGSHLFWHLRKKGLTKHEQEDVASETWLRAWKKIGNFEDRGIDLFPWLRTIAGLVMKEHLKSRYLGKPLEESALEKDSAFQDPNPNAIDRIGREEIRNLIKEVLHEAPPDYQQLINAKFFEEFEPEEIAQLYDWSINKVYVTTHRALSWLRQKLKDRYGIDIAKEWIA